MDRQPILIDLDGTILSDQSLNGSRLLGSPMDKAKIAIKKLREKYYIIVYTARKNYTNEQIKLHLNECGIIVDEVDNSKRFAKACIDDRTMTFCGWDNISTYEKFIVEQIQK